ncbi:MAG: hypothetical protein ACRCV3_03240 [Desulfovibrionaceae bacterium]
MRIAVQLFGNLRTYKQCSQSVKKNIIDNYDCDIFIHTWSKNDHSSQTHHAHLTKNPSSVTHAATEEFYAELSGKNESQNSIKEHILVETQNEQDLGAITTFNNKIVSIFGIYSLLHSMAESNRLREAYSTKYNSTYDFVLCIRPDIFLQKPFSIEYFLRGLTEKEIDTGFFTTGDEVFSIQNIFKYLGGTDLIFFARPHIISDLFAHKESILTKVSPSNVLPYPHEYHLVQTVEELGYTPYYIKYPKESHFYIARLPTKKSLIKNIIKIRIKSNFFSLHLFKMINKQILSIQCKLFNFFTIDICIGRKVPTC